MNKLGLYNSLVKNKVQFKIKVNDIFLNTLVHKANTFLL